MTTSNQKQFLLLDRCDVIFLGQLKSYIVHNYYYYYDSDLQIATKLA